MRFFCLPKIFLFFACVFSRKKMRKSRILTSQNHPQTLPKRLQNRCSKKHRFFRGFLLQFLHICYLGNLENINFPQGKPLFLRFSLKTCFCNFQRFSAQKTYQKPFQNEVRTMKKSMSKTCCFLTSIFQGSGLDLGASWASNLEPSWLKIEKNLVWVWSGCGLQSFLKLDVLKNRVLEGSGLDFRGSRPRFQRVLGPILRKCSTFSGLLW